MRKSVLNNEEDSCIKSCANYSQRRVAFLLEDYNKEGVESRNIVPFLNICLNKKLMENKENKKGCLVRHSNFSFDKNKNLKLDFVLSVENLKMLEEYMKEEKFLFVYFLSGLNDLEDDLEEFEKSSKGFNKDDLLFGFPIRVKDIKF